MNVRSARDEPTKISPHGRPAVRAGVVVLVEFPLRRAEHAGGPFHCRWAAASTALARPAQATLFACGLCTSEKLLSRRYPERFLASASCT